MVTHSGATYWVALQRRVTRECPPRAGRVSRAAHTLLIRYHALEQRTHASGSGSTITLRARYAEAASLPRQLPLSPQFPEPQRSNPGRPEGSVARQRRSGTGAHRPARELGTAPTCLTMAVPETSFDIRAQPETIASLPAEPPVSGLAPAAQHLMHRGTRARSAGPQRAPHRLNSNIGHPNAHLNDNAPHRTSDDSAWEQVGN